MHCCFYTQQGPSSCASIPNSSTPTQGTALTTTTATEALIQPSHPCLQTAIQCLRTCRVQHYTSPAAHLVLPCISVNFHRYTPIMAGMQPGDSFHSNHSTALLKQLLYILDTHTQPLSQLLVRSGPAERLATPASSQPASPATRLTACTASSAERRCRCGP